MRLLKHTRDLYLFKSYVSEGGLEPSTGLICMPIGF